MDKQKQCEKGASPEIEIFYIPPTNSNLQPPISTRIITAPDDVASKQRLSILMTAFACALIETDTSGAIVYENWGKLAKERGKFADPSAVSTIFHLVHPDKRAALESIISSVLANRKGLHSNVELELKERAPLPVRLTVAPVLGAENVLGLRWVLADRSDEQRREEERKGLTMQLQQSQRMEAIGTLAAGIAHDFNNILTAICGYVELALMDLGSERMRGYLAQVDLAANRARELVSRILSFGRKSGTGKGRLVMGAAIEEGVRFLRAMIPSTVEIRVSINDKDSCVSANPIDLQQVLINLASNAAQAIGSKPGVIKITLDRLVDGELPTELRRFDKGMGLIRLTVKDSGRGIPPETICRIFEPYFTTKPRGVGSGLGLSVVHTIVKSCGGAIQVSSALGQGAAFDVYLPRIQSAAPKAPEPEAIAGGSGSILLVDDEPVVRSVGKELLSRMGYNVITRSDPIRALKEFTANPEQFDLALIDQTMPGMTGNELARRFKEVSPGFPVILCSGYTSLFSGSSASLLCADIMIKKPFVVAELDKALRTLISARRPAKPKSPNRS